MKIKLILLSMFFLTTNTFAEDPVNKNDTNIITNNQDEQNIQKELINQEQISNSEVDLVNKIKEEKLSSKERIKIIMDEKKRLRQVNERRIDPEVLELPYFYINSTKYSDYTKGLLREATFYIYYMIENSEDEKLLKEESKNIAWNTICLSQDLKQDMLVVYPLLLSTIIDEKSEIEAKYNKSNYKIMKYMHQPATQEEMELRCKGVYK